MAVKLTNQGAQVVKSGNQPKSTGTKATRGTDLRRKGK